MDRSDIPVHGAEQRLRSVSELGWHRRHGPSLRHCPNTTNVTARRFPVLTCPSDIWNAPIGGITSHNYAANFGNTGNAQQANLNGVIFGKAPFGLSTDTVKKLGTRFAEMTDGTSNTILVAEVRQGQGTDLRGFSWWGDAAGFVTYIGPNSPLPDVIYTPAYCVQTPVNPPCTGTPTTTNPAMMGARSRHPGGVQMVMGDGSCKFVANTVNIDTWRAASTSQGGEVLQLD